MARSAQRQPRQGSRIAATVVLAWWQLRLTWRLLIVAGFGVVTAVILVCTVPLYSQVAISAGLRDALNTPENSSIVIHSVAYLISQSATEKVSQQLQQEMQQNLGPFLSGSQFSVQSPGLQVDERSQLQLIGWSLGDPAVRQHLKGIVAGSLPVDRADELDVAITPEAAQAMHLRVGATISVPVPFVNGQDVQVLYPLPLRISGIFEPGSASDPYWHGISFSSQAQGGQNALYPALVSNVSYLRLLDRASQEVSQGNEQSGASFETPSDLYWYYNFALDRLDSNQLDGLNNGLNNLLVSITNQPVIQPFVDKTSSSGPSSVISSYLDRITVARIPLLSLAYLIAGLMLFFVSLMTDLLVDRQSEAIAVLRSRGASREQIFSSLIIQSIGMGLLAFLIGPLLAVGLAYGLTLLTLPASEWGALNVILNDPISSALSLYLASLGTVIVSVLAMIFAINRAARMDVLALRREAARTTGGPAWLRMGLDLLAGVIALTGYGFSVYITSPGVLDARTRVLLLPPMTLVGAVFLLLGCMLLFLRIFPFLLEGLSKLALRMRGVTSMLAVAQMSRAPRQALRMTLLLALAVAFGIFSLDFNASQAQRIPTVAGYQIGADLSGTYPDKSALRTLPLAQQEGAFTSIPGVTSATVGYASSMRGSTSGSDVSIELRAVDAETFAQTAIWNAQDSSQPLSSLMQQLVDQRQDSTIQGFVPAIVDAAAWKALGLSFGAPFSLSDFNGTVNFIAIAEVNHIPTISDNAGASGTNDYVANGGVLADFLTYQAVLKASLKTTVLPTTVWLSIQHTATAHRNVLAALSSGALLLNDLNDRQAQEDAMAHDPLYLALLGVLLIGTATALLLGLLGNLTVSWLSARSRLISFAVMRALGTAPRQIASILTYEQLIIYATAIGLGVAFGILLSFLILPAFIFTSSIGNAIGGTGLFYISQGVPPIQMVIPGFLIALAVGLLIAICLVALGMMVRVVSRPALSSMLRLNSD
jgi:putative ABC transport system permease protein